MTLLTFFFGKKKDLKIGFLKHGPCRAKWILRYGKLFISRPISVIKRVDKQPSLRSKTKEMSDLGMRPQRPRRQACGGTVRAIGPALGLLVTLLARCGGVIVTSVKPNRGSLAGGTRLHIQVFQCVPICVPCAPCCTPPRQRVLGSDAWGAARCANVGSRAAQHALSPALTFLTFRAQQMCKLRGPSRAVCALPRLDGPARACMCLRRCANLGARAALHALWTGLRVRAYACADVQT